MAIIVVNESTVLAKADEAATLTPICAAIDKQVHEHFAPAWGREPWHVVYAASVPAEPNPAGYNDVIAHVIDADPNVPGALAYHDDPSTGVPDIYVLAQTILSQPGATWSTGTAAVSVGLSHEVLETIADPYCTWSASSADGTKAYALEVCDPVENASYDVDGVAVSDFVLPGWFNVTDASGAACDFLGRVHTPQSLDAGGYAIVTPQGQPTQVTGDVPADHGSRAVRRGVELPAGHAFA